MVNKRDAIFATALVVGAGTMFCLGSVTIGKEATNLDEAQRNRLVVEQKLNSIDLGSRVEHMVEALEKQMTITLAEREGVSSLDISSYDTKWNKWLTKSEAQISIEYKALVGIDVEDISFVQDGDKLLIVFNNSAFYVQAVEVVNKNIVLQRSIFGQAVTEEEKSAIEKQIVEEVKKNTISDAEVVSSCKDSLMEYLLDMANSFGVEDVSIVSS